MIDGIEGIGMTIDIGHDNTVGAGPGFFCRISGAQSHLHVHDNHGESDEHLASLKGRTVVACRPCIARDYPGIIVVEGRSLEEGKKSIAVVSGWFFMSEETFHVFFLGTAGALPTPMRNPPCIMVQARSDTLLFDCGEGAQQQMMRARTGFLVDAIFITHWHADHFLGIIGLIQTLSSWDARIRFPYTDRTGCTRCVTERRHLRFMSSSPFISIERLKHGSVIRFTGYSVSALDTDTAWPGSGMSSPKTPVRALQPRRGPSSSVCPRDRSWAAAERRNNGLHRQEGPRCMSARADVMGQSPSRKENRIHW